MTRRMLLAALLMPVAGAMPGAALGQVVSGQAGPAQAGMSARDRADVARAEVALNGLHTLKARFQQIAPNGAVSNGTAWLERPGRMRFEYDPPTPFLLVGGYGLLVFHDSQLGQTSNIPLGRTPVGLLLRDNLRLSGDVTVTRIGRLPGQLQITLTRTASPGDGSLTLIFADPPMALVSWTVVDAQRQETRIRLSDVQLGGTFDQSLFAYVDPRSLGVENPR